MKRAAALIVLASAAASAFAAPPSTPAPLPPSAVIFANESNTFNDSAEVWAKPVSVPQDGAWLIARPSTASTWMDCVHKYAGYLDPNFTPYPDPLFQVGPDDRRTEACLGNICYSCYTRWWGNTPTWDYETTNTNPGFMPAGSSTIGVKTLTGGGTHDTLRLYLAQINRDAMTEMTMFLSRAEDDPIPLQPDEIKSAYWIANSADRVAVVPEFHYGEDSFPAGPDVVFSATWDDGTVVEPEINTAPRMPLGYTIVGVQVPKLATGTHTFTVKATLPSGKTYTSEPMEVFIYAQNIYVTMSGNFNAKAPVDQAPQLVPGSGPGGASLDLAATAQKVDLNIIIGRGSRGTFDVKLTNVSAYPGVAMNHPITSPATTPDMDFGPGTEKLAVPIPKGGAPKVVTIPLYIRDYAASATVEVTMPYRKTTFTARQRLPIDVNKNGMPDAGWHALANSATGALNQVNDTHSAGSDGDNDPVVSGLPTEGITGDGLTAAEEYRGFYVRGSHRRLHPLKKDLFVLVDPVDEALDNRLLELPVTVHEVRPGETLGDLGPVVNPNRAGMTGATLQRGLRGRNRYPSPQYELFDGTIVAADHEAKGWTFQQGDNLNLISAQMASIGLVQSPNETLVCDVFDAAFWRHYISYGQNNIRQTQVAATDTDFPGFLAIWGGSDWLQSIPNSLNPNGDDFQTNAVFTVCGSAQNRPWRTRTVTELLGDYEETFLHEIAHGLDVEHDRINCSISIMSDEAAVPLIRPLTANDRSQIRIHRKHN